VASSMHAPNTIMTPPPAFTAWVIPACCIGIMHEPLAPSLHSSNVSVVVALIYCDIGACRRFASGSQPHILDVPTAQSCIQQLLNGPTAAALGKWNAQDVGNTVFAAAQVCSQIGYQNRSS
jgi:hypothetical protein